MNGAHEYLKRTVGLATTLVRSIDCDVQCGVVPPERRRLWLKYIEVILPVLARSQVATPHRSEWRNGMKTTITDGRIIYSNYCNCPNQPTSGCPIHQPYEVKNVKIPVKFRCPHGSFYESEEIARLNCSLMEGYEPLPVPED